MTTSASGRKLTSACNGVTTTFANPNLLSAADLSVYLLDAAAAANSEGTLLSEGADYVVAADLSTITTAIAQPVGKYLRRWRQTSRLQGVQIEANQGVPAATQEGALDRLSLVDEEQDDDFSRAVSTPAGEAGQVLPTRESLKGKYLAGDAEGDLVPSPGTGSDAALRGDLAAAAGSSLILHKMAGAGTFGRSLRQWAVVGGPDDNNVFNWIDSDFDPDILSRAGLSDATAGFQNALNAVMATGGGPLRAPAGLYPFSAGLTYDISGEGDRFAKRLRIVGDGSTTQFKFTGVAGTLITYTGNIAQAESYLDLDGIRLSGDNTIGSRGLYLNTAAFAKLNRVIVEGFDQNVDLLNVDQTLIETSMIRWGRKGLKTEIGTETAINSIVLINVAIGNNLINGIDALDLNLLTMIGGSIQYNGATGGGATNFGAKLNNPGTSYGPIKFLGVCFEGNGGEADLWIDSSANVAAINVDSCGFMRSTVGDYAVNNIRLDGDEATTLRLVSNGFRVANAYVPNAARPNLAINNLAAVVTSDGSNVFGSAVEAPSWYQSRWPITVNNGQVFVNGGQVVKAFAWNPALLNNGQSATADFAFAGAELGDSVVASFSTATGAQLLHAEVSAAGTVSVRLYNDTGGTLDLNGNVIVRLFKL